MRARRCASKSATCRSSLVVLSAVRRFFVRGASSAHTAIITRSELSDNYRVDPPRTPPRGAGRARSGLRGLDAGSAQELAQSLAGVEHPGFDRGRRHADDDGDLVDRLLVIID